MNNIEAKKDKRLQGKKGKRSFEMKGAKGWVELDVERSVKRMAIRRTQKGKKHPGPTRLI